MHPNSTRGTHLPCQLFPSLARIQTRQHQRRWRRSRVCSLGSMLMAFASSPLTLSLSISPPLHCPPTLIRDAQSLPPSPPTHMLGVAAVIRPPPPHRNAFIPPSSNNWRCHHRPDGRSDGLTRAQSRSKGTGANHPHTVTVGRDGRKPT